MGTKELFALFFVATAAPAVAEQIIKSGKIEFRIEAPEASEYIWSRDCSAIMGFFEKKYDLPQGLLHAIAFTESRCRPWAVNHSGKSVYFETSEAAIDYISQLDPRYNPSISIGCMQINWRVHYPQFANLREALFPYRNVQFAARLLCSLKERYGSWEKAVAMYNPLGLRRPNWGYQRKVWRTWKSGLTEG